MNGPTVFVAFDGDGIGRMVGRAVLNDDVEGLRRISQSIEAGEEIIKSWAIANGGSVIEAGGDEVTIELPASSLGGLEALREKYSTATGATLSAGVGKRLSHAAKALMASKLRGKDRSTFYDEEVEKEISAAAENEPTEAEKLREEYLQKAAGRIHATIEEPQMQVAEVEEAQEGALEGNYAPAQPEVSSASSKAEQKMHSFAIQQERHDKALSAKKETKLDEIKGRVAEALVAFRQQMPVFQQMQQVSPDAYSATLGIVKGLIELGRTVQASEEKIEKAIKKEIAIDPHGRLKKMLATAMPAGADQAEGMDNYFKDEALEGGASDGMRPEDFNPDALEIGTNEEMEHVSDRKVAQEIAMDHLVKDPNYYNETLKKLGAVEADVTEDPATDEELDKASTTEKMGHKRLFLPVGTLHQGRIKVRHHDGSEGWKSVKAGAVQGHDPSTPLFGANSHPVSSREPTSK